MSGSPPRLNVNPTDPAVQPGYAPISWTAVASLAVAVLFVLVLLVMGYGAWRDKQPLLQTWLLVFPAVAVLLAFVARRQIAASEGTRTGQVYATAGWWAAVVGGLGFAAYLLAISYITQLQAEREFDKFAKPLADLDAGNPKDPNLYASAYWTIDPGLRRAVKSPENVAAIDSVFADRVTAFRQLDLVRICARNRGQVEFRTHGLQDWQQKPTEITCSLSADLLTPEGEHRIVVPLRAVVDEKTRQQAWYVNPPREGFVTGRKLTRYGWLIEHTELTGRTFGQEFMGLLMGAGQAPMAYLGYVYPGLSPAEARDILVPIGVTARGRAAVGGAPGGWPYIFPKLSEFEPRLRALFTRPNGAPATPDQFRAFLMAWESPGRISPPGSVLKQNPDINSVLYLDKDRIEYRIPMEMAVLGDTSGQAAARGRIVLRPDQATEAALLQELAAAREAIGASPRTDEPPPDIKSRPGPRWRVVRIESDMVPLFNPKSDPRGAGPGGMPGF